jgi:hypothetical protein
MINMNKITVELKKVGGSLMLPIPKSIAELFSWNVGDSLQVPFHEFVKVQKGIDSIVSLPEVTGKEFVTVKIGTHEPLKVSQKEVIKILEKPTPDLNIYRTAYITWGGKRFGVKNLCKKLFGFEDFNTVQGEKYLRELGFPTFRE